MHYCMYCCFLEQLQLSEADDRTASDTGHDLEQDNDMHI